MITDRVSSCLVKESIVYSNRLPEAYSSYSGLSRKDVKGGEKVDHCGVAVQDKCPFKWPAEMSLGYAAMVSDEDVVGPAQGRRVGGPSAFRYFLTVALWIPNSRSIARSDIPLRLAF